MRAPRQLSVVVAAITAALLVPALAREASAAGTPSARWYVETVGTACHAQRSALEREITLACNAIGGTCSVGASPKESELRAVLDCSGLEESWTLVTRTRSGNVLGTLDLSGPEPDRLREAAVEIARDVEPEPAVAADVIRGAPARAEPPPPDFHAAVLPEKLTLVMGARGTSTNDSAPTTGGLHVIAGLALAKGIRGTVGAIGEAGGSGNGATRALRSGAGIALGAPFDGSAPVGFAAEGGVASTTATTALAGYFQGTVSAQWPRAGWRPYAALSAAALTSGIHIMASGELGIALGFL